MRTAEAIEVLEKIVARKKIRHESDLKAVQHAILVMRFLETNEDMKKWVDGRSDSKSIG